MNLLILISSNSDIVRLLRMGKRYRLVLEEISYKMQENFLLRFPLYKMFYMGYMALSKREWLLSGLYKKVKICVPLIMILVAYICPPE